MAKSRPPPLPRGGGTGDTRLMVSSAALISRSDGQERAWRRLGSGVATPGSPGPARVDHRGAPAPELRRVSIRPPEMVSSFR